MRRYVVGLMFDEKNRFVVLIQKNRPAWQKHRLNGIGGHIEDGEEPVAAMVREFQEETGLVTTPDAWEHTIYMVGADFEIYFFRTSIATEIIWEHVATRTDESIHISRIEFALDDPLLLPNLRWIIPFSMDPCAQLPLTVQDAPSQHDVHYSKSRVHT